MTALLDGDELLAWDRFFASTISCHAPAFLPNEPNDLEYRVASAADWADAMIVERRKRSEY